MIDVEALYKRWTVALNGYGDASRVLPGQWHPPDTKTFRHLLRELQPLAEAGNIHCQYAVATIYAWGLCAESEAGFQSNGEQWTLEATRFWDLAARRGHPYALDNFITSGIGPKKEILNEMIAAISKERPELTEFSPEFCRLLYERISGRPNTKEWYLISPGVSVD